MPEGLGSNVRVRVNIAFFDPKNLPTAGSDFQKGLSWEELRQYRDLFWNNQTGIVMACLTPAQRQEMEFLERNNIKLPDPFNAVCTAHEAFLSPAIIEDPAVDEDEGEVVVIESVHPDEEAEITRGVESPGVPDPQAEVYGSPPTSKYLVLAPPGTGKTYTVLKRFAFLEQHYEGDLNPVLAVTFSTAASAELQQRLFQELEDSAGSGIQQLPNLRTLDSFSGQVLANIGESLPQGDYDDSIRKLARVLEGHEGKDARSEAASWIRQQVGLVVVDEVQDVVGVRARLIIGLLELLKGKDFGLMVLGDLRQAIHGFQLRKKGSKAEPEERKMTPFWLVRKIRSLFPDAREKLFEKAWRFKPNAQETMRALRGAMDDPTGEYLPGEKPDRMRIREIFEDFTELDHPVELAGAITEGKSTAILARYNSQVRKLEVACTDVLYNYGRKVRVVTGSATKKFARFPGWIGRLFGRHDTPVHFSEDTFLEEYEACVSFNRREARERLEDLWSSLKFDSASFSKQAVIDAIASRDSVPTSLREKPAGNEIWISTIHQAKGREFDVVVVADPLSPGKGPLLGLLQESKDKEAEEENSRLAYVAATRTRTSPLYRCQGKNWLPEIFHFKNEHFDFDAMAALYDQGEEGWGQLQENLWQCHLGLRRLKLFSPDGARFVLEVPEGEAGKSQPVIFSDAFTEDFRKHAKREWTSMDSLTTAFTVRMIGLDTVVWGADNRVLLVPDLSGNIVRN